MNFTNIAHDDHGLSDGHVDAVMADPTIAAMPEGGFVLTVIDIPEGLEALDCALYGPEVGDAPVGDAEVTLEARGGRAGPSRLVDRPHRPARRMVVVGIKGGVCFTAYGTRAKDPSPMEPWDADRKCADGKIPEDERARAHEFWAAHALAR